MDSDTKIGVVTQIIIESKDVLNNEYEIKLKNDNTKMLINPDATYSNVDTAARALIQLTSNNYVDTICVTNISVGEVMAG